MLITRYELKNNITLVVLCRPIATTSVPQTFHFNIIDIFELDFFLFLW